MLFAEPEWLQEAMRLWQPLPMLWVDLKPPLDTCVRWGAQRESTHAGRPTGSGAESHARHAGDVCGSGGRAAGAERSVPA
ncbi:hypothetical protein [Deinococcus sonorensis]|uniref:Uncharacterized protein n=1 Tax=Deinococcus sonorensis TaxID=309891 RepID=A0ABV8Y8Z2_9DEIO